MFFYILKLIPFIACPILVILAGCTGHEIIRRLFSNSEDGRSAIFRSAQPILSILVGASFIHVALYLFSLFKVMTPAATFVLLGIQAVVAIRSKDFFSSIVLSFRTLIAETGSSLLERSAIALGFAVWCFFVVWSLLLSTIPSFDADTSSTYFAAARLFLNYGEFINNGHAIGAMAKVGFPHLVYGIGLFSPELAHAWTIGLAGVGLLLLQILLIYAAGSAVGVLLFIAFVGSPFIIDTVVVPAKFDGLSLAFSTGAIAILFGTRSVVAGPRAYCQLGILAGSLAGLSYNNIPTAAALVLLFVLMQVSFGYKQVLAKSLCLLTAAAIFSWPTFGQNLILFGNPVYPFASDLFRSGLGYDIPTTSYFYGYISLLRVEFAVHSIGDISILLARLFGRDYSPELQSLPDPRIGAILLLSLTIGVVPAVLASLGRSYIRSDRILNVGLCAAWCLLFCFWAFTQHILRYLSAMIPVALILIALSVGATWRLLGKSRLWAMMGINAAILMVSVWVVSDWMTGVVPSIRKSVEWLRSPDTRDQYIEKNFSYGGAWPLGRVVAKINGLLPPHSKLMSFINGNSFFDPTFVVFLGNGSNAMTSPHGLTRPLAKIDDWHQWEAILREQGFNYLVIDPSRLYLTTEERGAVAGFLSNRRPMIDIEGTLVFDLGRSG